MSRREFPVKVKKQAKERCNGFCENGTRIINGAPITLDGCGLPLVGRPQYDHIQPDGLQGEPTLENCQVLCSKCHTRKTHQVDRPIMAKADRQKKANDGIKSKRGGFRGWRNFRGEAVFADKRRGE